jgi:hypothetical protein
VKERALDGVRKLAERSSEERGLVAATSASTAPEDSVVSFINGAPATNVPSLLAQLGDGRTSSLTAIRCPVSDPRTTPSFDPTVLVVRLF